MWRKQSTRRLYLSFSTGDMRLQDQLCRHLTIVCSELSCELASRLSVQPGKPSSEQIREALLTAHVVVVLATARYFADSCATAELDLALERFSAGEIHLLTIHVTDCMLDPRLVNTAVLTPESFTARNREPFWKTCAARIASLSESSLPDLPSYEDEHNQAAGEALRLLWWSGSGSERGSCPLVWHHQRGLRQDGRLKPGDILAHRFHVRRPTGERANDPWEGYDFSTRRFVDIHAVGATAPSCDEDVTRRLQRFALFHHPAAVRVLTAPFEEPLLPGKYVVVERFPGQPLRAAILKRDLAGARALEALAPVASAVAALHQTRLVHGAVGTDTIRVGVSEEHLLCKLVLTPESLTGQGREREPTNTSKTAGQDVAGFVRAVLSCLHGAPLPPGASAAQLRRILEMKEASAELKALLARNLTPETARSQDLVSIAGMLKDAGTSRSDRAAARFDLDMRVIRGGAGWLGAAPGDARARFIERPRRRVVVQGFELCAYPVTQRLFTMIMGRNPSAHVDPCAPVHNVSFHDAIEFCNRLSMQHGLQACYEVSGLNVAWIRGADGYRLPTEAEWEYAAKDDTEAPYIWGLDEPRDRVCWTGLGNSLGLHNRRGPSPVWSHPESATRTGIFDLLGNVWEWCWDRYAPYSAFGVDPGEPLMEPAGPSVPMTPPVPSATLGGDYRILRGGAWNVEDSALMRTSMRSMDLATKRDPDVGFRLARGAKPLAREIPLRPEVAATQDNARSSEASFGTS